MGIVMVKILLRDLMLQDNMVLVEEKRLLNMVSN